MTDHLLFHVKVPLHTSPLGLETTSVEHEDAIIAAIQLLAKAGMELTRADHHEPATPAPKVRASRRTAAQIEAEAQALAREMAAE